MKFREENWGDVTLTAEPASSSSAIHCDVDNDQVNDRVLILHQ